LNPEPAPDNSLPPVRKTVWQAMELPWLVCAPQFSHHQRQIESAALHQQSFKNVALAAVCQKALNAIAF